MDGLFDDLTPTYDFFLGGKNEAEVEMLETRFEEFDSDGDLILFRLRRGESWDNDFPFTFINNRYTQKPARFHVINSTPIASQADGKVKFLIDILTRDGNLFIGLLVGLRK